MEEFEVTLKLSENPTGLHVKKLKNFGLNLGLIYPFCVSKN